MSNTTMATGTTGGHAAEFIPVHRQYNETPVVLELTMRVPMSLEDVTAALWLLVSDYPRDELMSVLGDAQYLHTQILETVFAEGSSELDNVRLGFADIEAGTLAHEYLTVVRARVAELYGPATTRRPRSCVTAGRRTLAEVS